MLQILILDNQQLILTNLRTLLERENYKILKYSTASSLLKDLREKKANLILIESSHLDFDHVQFIHDIRKFSFLPIIIISKRNSEIDKVITLNAGADDYLTIPFSANELLARIKSQLRRTQYSTNLELQDKKATTEEELILSPFRLNFKSCLVYKNNLPLSLSAQEFDLLHCLISHPNKVLSRQFLLEKIWDYDYLGDTRLVDVAVRRLRKKLEDNPSRPQYICNRRGFGYYFNSKN